MTLNTSVITNQYCKKCGVVKPWTEEYFYWQENCGRFAYSCKACVSVSQSKYKKVYCKTERGWAQKLVEAARRRAKEKGLECNLTADWVRLSTPLLCPVLGIRLVRGVGKVQDASPTLDRIDNSKGYIIGNVQIISFKANRAKNNLTFEEVERLFMHMLNANTNTHTAA